jgi:hypothetical protein
MSNIFVEGFSTYGTGTLSTYPSNNTLVSTMLAGRWAAIFSGGVANAGSLGTLPWAPSDPDIYYGVQTPATGNYTAGARVVLPAATVTAIVSAYVAGNALPALGVSLICTFSDSSNYPIAALAVTSTGTLVLGTLSYSGVTPPPAWAVIASSDGPVMTAESAGHLEMSLTSGGGGAVTVQFNGVTVVSATGLVFSQVPGQPIPTANTNSIAQITFCGDASGSGGGGSLAPIIYIGNLIIRNTAGTYNTGIVGDRRVATLIPASDDLSIQGWTGFPLHRFGVGILDLTATDASAINTAVTAAPSAQLDIGASQFTIEGSFRFQYLPTSNNKAVLFGKWDQPNNKMSYELYVGGPSLESGNTVFRISTDGTAGTINELISWSYTWVVGQWYHVAVSRDGSNNTRLFINGILQGLAVSDANTYYSGGASSASACLGGETNGSAVVNGTGWPGWMDEFRLTIGYCRYTASFSPPVAAFPRGSDPEWAFVPWISGWDSASIVDESADARTLTGVNGAAAITPNDGTYNYQCIDKIAPPYDNTFIEAALLTATSLLTYVALPTATDTIRVGTKDGTNAAVYTWAASVGAAFTVKIGASISASMSNLAAAINAGAGAGTLYGTGTTINFDVNAIVLSSGQLEAIANNSGNSGNSIVTTSTDTHGTWTGGTLAGGQSIPGPSQFGYTRLPSNVTIVDSATIVGRAEKTDSGTCAMTFDFVGGGGGVSVGPVLSVTTAPTFYSNLFETDPDTAGVITPSTILLGNMRVNRTS